MSKQEFTHQLLQLNTSLKGYALSLTSDSTEAKDLLQETYLKALSNYRKFEPHTNLKGWVFTIMRNTFINGYKRSNVRETHLNSLRHQRKYSLAPTAENPLSVCISKEIERDIDGLDEIFKKPLSMFLKGYSYQDISDKLNAKMGTVKSRIFYARKKIKELHMQESHRQEMAVY